MRPPSLHVAVCLLVATSGLGGLLARPAAAADWAVRPAANHFGPGRPDYRYTISPGGRVQDAVAVVNGGSAPLRLALRATGIAPWIRLSRDDVTVAPGASVDVPFAVALPGDAAPGDRVGDIVTTTPAGERARIPIRLRVGGALEPSLAVEHVSVHRSGGDATVTYTIHNTGNAILTAHQTVSLTGPFGRWAADAGKVADPPPLLPGARREVSVPVSDVTPALRLTATVTLVPLLTDAAGSTAPLAATEAVGHTWAVPWPALLVILALCALVAAARTRGRVRA